jgi:hypothetical protein
MNPHERFKDYQGSKCWQAHISEVNLKEDLLEAGMSIEDPQKLQVSDFVFEYVDKENREVCAEIKRFIERHEWLGKMPVWITQRFTARLKKTNQLAGVIIMATPNSFSYLLGKDNKDLEKLIARGACISWAPKNLGSWLITKSIKWMVKNTQFRVFTAYSDPEAKELGTIYQACNFFYLGQQFGAGKQYLDPDNLERGWFGSSGFSDRSQIVRYAKKLGIEFDKSWYKFVGKKKNYRKVNWKTIPEDVAKVLKKEQAEHKARCKQRPAAVKHKYAFILGATKAETKKLRRLFGECNPGMLGLEYPKERGK